MAKSQIKTGARFVSRILDRTATPVYLVNTDYMVVYANQACADWAGVELEELVSGKCVFGSQSQDDPTAEKLQGLCPPPSCFDEPADSDSENDESSHLVYSINTKQEKSWRTATMSPLFDDEHFQTGILVVCGESCSAPTTDSIQCAKEPKWLHQALAQIRTKTDSRYSLESIVGVSPFADRMRRQVQSAIDSNSDLIIHGSRGTGKEHLARTIHSARAGSADFELLPVHCSIADQVLIQQNIKDIVSSRSGSNYSSNQKQDWLLLLDVDRLGEAAQGELLGFLQLPNFPLRTIATANQSLIKLAKQGKYSSDLAYRLSTLPIELAPLAKRHLDIPLLAQALLERDNFRRDKQMSGFSKSAMQLLTEFNWPENIDQLNRVVQSASVNATTSEIGDQDLPDEFTQALSALRIGTNTETEIKLDDYLAKIEKELVDRALKQSKGNKTKASKLLGISRPKLLRRIQLFGFEASPDFAEIDEDEEIELVDKDSSDAKETEELR